MTNGRGTTIVLSIAKSNTYALCVSGPTTRHAIAPNGSMRFLLVDRMQQYPNDYSRRSHQPPDHTALTCPRPSLASISRHVLPTNHQAQRLLNLRPTLILIISLSPCTPDCKQQRDQTLSHSNSQSCPTSKSQLQDSASLRIPTLVYVTFLSLAGPLATWHLRCPHRLVETMDQSRLNPP